MNWNPCHPKTNLLKILWVALLLLSLTAVFCHDILLNPSEIVHGLDILWYHYFYKYFAIEEIKKGAFPLWLPYTFLGLPFLAAMQAGCFYPSILLYLVLPLNLAFGYDIMLHIFLAGLCMYLLALYLLSDHISALFSSIVFMFSGYYLTKVYAGQPNILAITTWLPLVFLCLKKSLDSPKSFYYIILTGLILTFQLFAGHPQFFYFILLILGSYALFRTFSDWKGGERLARNTKPLMTFFLVGLILAGLGAIQILPVLESLRSITRAHNSYSFIIERSFEPSHSISLFTAPNLIKNSDIVEATAGRVNWEMCSYLGILPFLLGLWGATYFKQDQVIGFFILIALTGLLLSFGHYTPFFPMALQVIPGLSFFRQSTTFLFLTFFSFAILAGFGYKHWQDLCCRKSGLRGRFTIFLLSLGIMIFLNGLSYYRFRGALAQESIYMPLLWFSLSVSLLLGGLFLKIARPLTGLFAIALVVADLYLFGSKYIFTEPQEILSPFPFEKVVIDAAKNEDFYRVAYPPGNNRLIPWHIFMTWGYDPFLLDDYIYFWGPIEGDYGLVDLLNVKYIITNDGTGNIWQNHPLPRDKYAKIAPYIYKNRDPLPRAFMVYKYLVRQERQGFHKALRDPRFRYRETMILNEIPQEERRKGIPDTPPIGFPDSPVIISWPHPLSPAEVEITHYEPRRIILQVDSPADGLLVLSEQYYPGWKALVDDKEQRIYQTDLVLRSIYLTKGSHRVEFIYNPLSFKLGLALSLSTLVALAIFSAIYLLKGRKSHSG